MALFSDRVDAATTTISNSSLKSAVRTAVKDFQTAIQAPLAAPGRVTAGYRSSLDDKLVLLAESVAGELKELTPTTTTTTTAAP